MFIAPVAVCTKPKPINRYKLKLWDLLTRYKLKQQRSRCRTRYSRRRKLTERRDLGVLFTNDNTGRRCKTGDWGSFVEGEDHCVFPTMKVVCVGINGGLVVFWNIEGEVFEDRGVDRGYYRRQVTKRVSGVFAEDKGVFARIRLQLRVRGYLTGDRVRVTGPEYSGFSSGDARSPR
ncbi:hypothetical protein VTL71DRAFT_15445 [Oculimacula yallundae]|uniref:Uncharacterized protein n=1 Tax=Oculimacula yallundae TaxID=86028 RepID=A0ABR4CHY2_9HELO